MCAAERPESQPEYEKDRHTAPALLTILQREHAVGLIDQTESARKRLCGINDGFQIANPIRGHTREPAWRASPVSAQPDLHPHPLPSRTPPQLARRRE